MFFERVTRTCGLAGLVVCLLVPAMACADDLYGSFRTPHADWSLFAGADRTDNATLQPNGPKDTILTAGVGGSLYRDTGPLKADLDGVGYHENYVDNTYDSHWLGNFRGRVAYAFVPDRFDWVVEDAFGQVNANPLLPTTPPNRVSGNYVSTGPDGYLRFGSDLGLVLGARYAQSDYQSNPVAQVDDRRVTGNIGLVKRLSAADAVSLNGYLARIEYRVPGNPGYDQAELYGRYEARNARSGAAIDVGGTELRDSVTRETVHDPLLRATLFHRLSPSWNVNLTAGQQYQNTATALQSALNQTRVVNGQTTPGVTSAPPGTTGTSDVILSQSPYRSEYLTLAFDFVAPRTLFGVIGRLERQRYQFGGSALDRNLEGGGVTFSRQMRPSLSFVASAEYDRREPVAQAPGDRTKLGDVGFEWRPGAMLTARLAYHREDRAADAGGFSYVVNRIYLGLSYGPPKRAISFQPPGTGTQLTAPPRP